MWESEKKPEGSWLYKNIRTLHQLIQKEFGAKIEGVVGLT